MDSGQNRTSFNCLELNLIFFWVKKSVYLHFVALLILFSGHFVDDIFRL